MNILFIDEDGDSISAESLVVDCSICRTMVLSKKVEHRLADNRPVCRLCALGVLTFENEEANEHEHSHRRYIAPDAPSAAAEDAALEWEAKYSALYRLLEDGCE